MTEMPRYFFHVKRGQMTVLDHEGLELAHDGEAAGEAARRGRGIAAREAGVSPSVVIIVADEHWRPVFQVPLGSEVA